MSVWITHLYISFAGSFQARLAVGFDPGDSSPTDPYGTYGKKAEGGTYAYREKPFDRIIRLSQPVDLRNARMDPWEDTTVKSVEIDWGRGLKPVAPGNPLLGQVVSLGTKAKFIEGSEGYEVDSMVLSVGPFFTARPEGTVAILKYENDTKAKAEYQTKKPALIKANQSKMDPVRAKVLAEISAKDNFDSWSTIFTSIGPYKFYLDPQSVQFSARFGGGRAAMDPLATNYLWIARLVFSRWDHDTLGGQLSGGIRAVHSDVLRGPIGSIPAI